MNFYEAFLIAHCYKPYVRGGVTSSSTGCGLSSESHVRRRTRTGHSSRGYKFAYTPITGTEALAMGAAKIPPPSRLKVNWQRLEQKVKSTCNSQHICHTL